MDDTPGFESCLVVLVPEAEPVVRFFREKFDPSAALGMPAHITINYPFQAGQSSLPDLFEKLKSLFSKCPPIHFLLGNIDQFPGVLYLEPNPVSPFIELIQAAAREFPESPPYNGEFNEIIPHLTIAQIKEEKHFDEIKSEFCEFSQGLLPVVATAEYVCFMDNRDENWTVRKRFQLRGAIACNTSK